MNSRLSLTPALSRWERESVRARAGESARVGWRAGSECSPSPSEGEGRGEGENVRSLAACEGNWVFRLFSLTPALSRWERGVGACASRRKSACRLASRRRAASLSAGRGDSQRSWSRARWIAVRLSAVPPLLRGEWKALFHWRHGNYFDNRSNPPAAAGSSGCSR